MTTITEKCRMNSSVMKELEVLLCNNPPERIAGQCDRQMGLLMCLDNGESEGGDYFFLSELRDTFNRIAVILGREPFKPGIETAAAAG